MEAWPLCLSVFVQDVHCCSFLALFCVCFHRRSTAPQGVAVCEYFRLSSHFCESCFAPCHVTLVCEEKVMYDEEEVEEEEVYLPSCVCLHTVVGMKKETDGILK